MGSIHCLFCGGRTCKYENFKNWVTIKKMHIGIEGLYSNWITDEILATARPSSQQIDQYGIVEQFKKYTPSGINKLTSIRNGITAIINLQEPGEHANCGHGIGENGFSYKPEEFMDNKSKCWNRLILIG